MEAIPSSRSRRPPAQAARRLRERAEAGAGRALRLLQPDGVPTLQKITLNMGIGEAKQNTQMLEAATEQLATIAGQAPSVRRAKKSIASKVREQMPVGVAVTLRRAHVGVLDRLIVAIPSATSRSSTPLLRRAGQLLDRRPRADHLPEIDYDSIDEVRGLDITITTTAASDVEAFALLDGLGMPFAADGRPGEVDKAAEEEEERRKEEARQRAEAEEAALEQLKEENPEAYAKRERPRRRGRRRARPARARGSPRAKIRRRPQERPPDQPTRTMTPPRAGTTPKRRKADGQDVPAGEAEQPAEVQIARLQPLPPLRPLRAYYRKFGLCRICLREQAHQGYVPGSDQVELVRSPRTHAYRSHRRLPDPDPQRARGRARGGRDPVLAPGKRRGHASSRQGYITDFATEQGEKGEVLRVALRTPRIATP